MHWTTLTHQSRPAEMPPPQRAVRHARSRHTRANGARLHNTGKSSACVAHTASGMQATQGAECIKTTAQPLNERLLKMFTKPEAKRKDAWKLVGATPSVLAETWITLPADRRPKEWDLIEEPVVMLERNLYGHPLAGLLWEKWCKKKK